MFKSYDNIFTAASYGSVQSVKKILAQGIDINLQDEKGKTALFQAVIANEVRAVKYLLKKGANPDIIDNCDEKWAAIHFAAAVGMSDIVEVLLKYGASVEIKDKQGRTPLLIASFFKNNLKTVKVLLKGGADINSTDNNGWTALHCAAVGLSVDIVDFLIRQGANVAIRNKKGMTAKEELISDAKGKFISGCYDWTSKNKILPLFEPVEAKFEAIEAKKRAERLAMRRARLQELKDKREKARSEFMKNIKTLAVLDKINPQRNEELLLKASQLRIFVELFEDDKMSWQQQHELYKQLKPVLFKPINTKQKKVIQRMIFQRKSNAQARSQKQK